MCGDQTTLRDADKGVGAVGDDVDAPDACILTTSTLRGTAKANLAVFSLEDEWGGVRRAIVVAGVVVVGRAQIQADNERDMHPRSSHVDTPCHIN